MIVAHAHLVIVSMVGAATVAAGHNKGAAMLSTLFFAVFGITESARMLMVIAWLSPMKEKYLAATDTVAQQMLRLQMESFGQLSIAMFLLVLGCAHAVGICQPFLGKCRSRGHRRGKQ
jgi:hypothetical protein